MEFVKLRNPGPPERGAKAKPSRLALEAPWVGWAPYATYIHTSTRAGGWVAICEEQRATKMIGARKLTSANVQSAMSCLVARGVDTVSV